MHALPRLLLASALAIQAGLAWAGASSTPFGYTPDPALKTASLADLQGRVRDSCAATQARIQNSTPVAMGRPCGCYARQVMRSFAPAEIDAYRNTGVFNETGRSKALAAIDSCGLRRPI